MCVCAEDDEFDETYTLGLGEERLEVLGYRRHEPPGFLSHFGRTAQGCYHHSYTQSQLRETSEAPCKWPAQIQLWAHGIFIYNV